MKGMTMSYVGTDTARAGSRTSRLYPYPYIYSRLRDLSPEESAFFSEELLPR